MQRILRILQSTGLLCADEMPVPRATFDDIDADAALMYFLSSRRRGVPLDLTPEAMPRLMRSLNLAAGEPLVPNLAGVMLFGRSPQTFKPVFVVKAFAFTGETMNSSYMDRQEIGGTIAEQYEHSLAFIYRNLHHVPSGPSFNSQDVLEIPQAVFEELLVNALVHRDYFINAPIRLFIFSDRVEIISPGCLPNNLTAEQIRFGVSNIRNSTLCSHAFHILPYSGIGNGIPRAAAAWPSLEFTDEREINQFRAVARRRSA
ncbi:MAG: hypothetical protein LBR38_08990 [Synergistaceae bacterium]|nr:hypothetical protein [Synergistaceae bacterium]